MTERRRWKAEEKLAIIKEAKENGKVVEICRKYSIDPGMYYKWKEFYDTSDWMASNRITGKWNLECERS
jgi:transposase-like protein